MSGADLAAVIVAISSVLALGVIAVAFWSILQTLRRVTTVVEQMRDQASPLMSGLEATIDKADSELDRVDGILDTAEEISGTVASASRLIYLAFSNPLVKGLAFLSGLARGWRKLRKD